MKTDNKRIKGDHVLGVGYYNTWANLRQSAPTSRSAFTRHLKQNDLINILNPILNSESVWKSHSLYLLAEYFLSKNEKQKSKEFLVQIIELENANPKIKVEAQKRINRDLSD